MRIRDLSLDQIQVGLRILGLKSGTPGTVIKIDPADDYYCWVHFDNEGRTTGGWYGNNCDCEVVLDKENKPISAIWQCSQGHNNVGIHTKCAYCPPDPTEGPVKKSIKLKIRD
jgi:hypothetical protein